MHKLLLKFMKYTVIHNMYLFFSHIHSSHMSARSNEFRNQETINTRATSQVNDVTSGQIVWSDESATVVPTYM